MPGRPDRRRVSSGSIWEPIAGYSRAVRVGERHPRFRHHRDPWRRPLRRARRCRRRRPPTSSTRSPPRIAALGGRIEDVVRTRIYLPTPTKWEPVSRAHGRVFGEILPANTLIEAGDLIGDYEVEIEAEAVCD